MPELNEVERAREWLRKTYDLETHTGRAYTISSEHGRLDVEKVLASYASERVRLASDRMMRKAFELSLPIKASDLEQLRAAIEKEGE